MNLRDFGGRKVVLKALTGSHNYNLNTPQSDRDYKFFVAPTFEDLYFGKMFSGGAQSETEDYTAHDIRQLSNLLWKANLNFIEVLFSREMHMGTDPFFSFILENCHALSLMNLRAFGNATMGMHHQKMKSMSKGTAKTQASVDKFGYDTKDALHALRCLFVLERVGLLGMNIKEALWFDNTSFKKDILLAVKAGKYSRKTFLDMVESWRKFNHDDVMTFFNNCEPNVALKEELDEQTKSFVKRHLNL